MNIAICDDEKIHCEITHKHIQNYMQTRYLTFNITYFMSAKSLLSSNKKFDILFMDIELGTENGLEATLEYQKQNKCLIILLTSHIEEMPNGYKVKAFRFLVKPIDQILLSEALDSALIEINNRKVLQIYDNEETKIISITDIIYIEAGDKASGIRTSDGFYKCKNIISELEKTLNPLDFYSPHRSYIVNMSYIKEYTKKEIVLLNKERIKISRLKYSNFKLAFQNFIQRRAEYVLPVYYK